MIAPRNKEFIQAKRGAPITILFVLLLAGRPMSVEELADVTRYDRETVRRGLLALGDVATQLAPIGARWGRWTLTDAARQMFLPTFEPLGIATATDALPAATATGGETAAATATGSATYGDEGISRIASSVVVVDPDPDLLRDQQQQQAMRDFPASNPEARETPNPRSAAERDAAFRACVDWGIIGDKREQLLADPWVTADRIARAARQAEAEKRWANPIGMAITRLLAHSEPADEDTLARLEAPPARDGDIGRKWQEFLNGRT